MPPIMSFNDYRDTTLEAVELYNQKEYKKSLERFLEMEKTNFKNIKIHEMLILVHIKLENLPEADRQFAILQDLLREENIVLEKPKTFEDLVQKAGSVQKAEKKFEKLMESIETDNLIENSEIPFNLSYLYLSEGNYAKAEEVILQFREKFLAAQGA